MLALTALLLLPASVVQAQVGLAERRAIAAYRQEKWPPIEQAIRDALKVELQRIHVRFDEKTAPTSNYPNGLSFANGVLDINWRPFSNVADVQDRTKALTQIMEKNL